MEVIQTMTRIIESVEDSPLIKVPISQPMVKTVPRYITKSICYHASQMADTINAKAITTLTTQVIRHFKFRHGDQNRIFWYLRLTNVF